MTFLLQNCGKLLASAKHLVSSIRLSKSTNSHDGLAAQVIPAGPHPLLLVLRLWYFSLHEQRVFGTFCILDSVTGAARSTTTAGILSRCGMIGFNSPFKSARTGDKRKALPGGSIRMFKSLIAALGLRDPLDGPRKGPLMPQICRPLPLIFFVLSQEQLPGLFHTVALYTYSELIVLNESLILSRTHPLDFRSGRTDF